MLVTALIVLAAVLTVFWLIPKLRRNVAAARRAEAEYAAAQLAQRQAAERLRGRGGRPTPNPSAVPFTHTVSAPVPPTRTGPNAEPRGPVWLIPGDTFSPVPARCAESSSAADTSASSDSSCSSDSGSSTSDSSF